MDDNLVKNKLSEHHYRLGQYEDLVEIKIAVSYFPSAILVIFMSMEYVKNNNTFLISVSFFQNF